MHDENEVKPRTTEDPDDRKTYEEPVLLGADDLYDVSGGCVLLCFDGDCRPKEG